MSMSRTATEILKDLRYAVNPFDTEEKEVKIEDINKLIHDFSLQADHATHAEIADGLEQISFLVSKISDLNFAEIDKLYKQFVEHPDTKTKQKADWAYKRLLASQKIKSDQQVNLTPEINPREVKSEDVNKILHLIFVEQTFPLKEIYNLFPFNDKHQDQKTVLNCILEWLIQSKDPLLYKQTIFNKVCQNLLPYELDHYSTKEISNLLRLLIRSIQKGFILPSDYVNSLITHIHDHLENADLISAETILYAYAKLAEYVKRYRIDICITTDAFNHFHKEQDLPLETLTLICWSIAKLVSLKQYPSLDINKFQDILDRTYKKIASTELYSFNNTGDIQQFLWSCVKVMEERKNATMDGKPVKNITIDEKQIKLLFDMIYELRNKTNSQQISINLWAISRLIEMKNLQITFERSEMDELLRLFLNRTPMKSEELANLLFATSIFGSKNIVSLDAAKIILLFNRLYTHSWVKPEEIIKGVLAMTLLIDANKLDMKPEILRKVFYSLNERDRTGFQARTILQWLQNEESKMNVFSKNQRNPLFAASRNRQSVTPTASTSTIHVPFSLTKRNYTD